MANRSLRAQDFGRPLASEFPQHDAAHFALLRFDGLGRVDDVKSHLLNHGLVFHQDASLEDAEAFLDVAAQAQIHARFVILQRVAPAQNAAQRHLQRNLEIKRQVGWIAKR